MNRLLFLFKKNSALALLVVSLFAGALGSWGMVQDSDRQMRADRIEQARLITQALNVEQIKSLAGSEADLVSPDYQSLKQLLTAMRTVDPKYRFIYLLGRQSDGTIFIFVDSEPSDSPDYSPPGQIYAEISAEGRRVFDSRTAFVEGPVSDRWGTWVSAMVPLFDPHTGQVLAVVGLDISAGDWNWDLAARVALPVGLLLAVLLLGFTYGRLRRADKLVSSQHAKLQESGQQFHNMFNGHSAVMLLIEPDSGRIRDANNAASQFYGYSGEQLKSMSIDELNCLDPSQVAIERARALHKENNYFIFQHKLASGAIRAVESYSTPINFSGETVLFSILHDITERKQAEAALQWDKQALAKLLSFSEEFLEDSESAIDFQKITDNLLQISGGKFAVFNLFADNGRDFQTVAISGLSESIKRATSVLGFDLMGKKWPHDAVRAAKTRDNTITRFASLFDLTENGLPKATMAMLVKPFNLGEMLIAKISTNEKVIGDFTIIMATGESFTANHLVSIYIRQVGLLLQRKQTEAALRASQQVYRQLVEQVPEVIYTDEIGGTWRYIGPNIQALCGYTAEELIADPVLWMNIIPAEDRSRLLAEVNSLAVGDVLNSEYRIQTKDRGLIWVRDHGIVKEDSSQPRPGETRRKKLIRGLVGEITQQKEVEIALHQSQERFKQLSEVFPETIFEIDLLGKVTYINAHGYQSLGITDADIEQGINILSLVIPEERQIVEEWAIHRVDGLTENFLEYKALRKNGQTFDVMAYAVPILSEAQITGIRGFILDISKRKRAEQALADSEANFRTFFETIDDIIVVATPQGAIRFGNASLLRKLGYSQEELRAMQVLEMHPADRRQEAEGIFAAMFRGERANCPLPLAAKNGSLIPVETRVWIGRWSGEECIFGVSKDLSAEQEAQQRFERLFRNSPTLMALSSIPERRFTDVNNAFLAILGYAPEEVIGKTSADLDLFVNPAQQKGMAEQLETSGRINELELQVRRKDGLILDGLFSGELIKSQDKAFFLTVMIDISERKRADAALQLQYRLQQLLVEISSTYINLPLDAVATMVQASLGDLGLFVGADRVYLFDYDFDQQTCKNTFEWCAEGIEPQINELQAVPLAAIPDWVAAHLEGESMSVPDVLALPAGGTRDILEPQGIRSLLAVPLMNAGSCLGFVGFDWVKQSHVGSESEHNLLIIFAQMLVNIQLRKQSEALLRDREARFRSLFDDSPISLWEEDFSEVKQRLDALRADGVVDFNAYFSQHLEAAAECIGLVKVMDVNTATLSLFAAAGKTDVFANLAIIFPEEAIEYFCAELALIASGATNFEMETINCTLDGKLITVAMNWAVSPGYESDLSKVIVSLLDITERKRAEAQLRDSNRQLEESTSRAKIFAAQAEMASVAKSQFLANMSHEIRTPMNGVVGMTGLLLDTNLDDEQRRFAEIVRSSAEALLTLINDILDFSKVEAGKLELETLDFDLLSMLDDFAATVAVRAQEKGLELLCSADSDVPAFLQGDPGRLRQILTNLVGNAIKFTSRGEISVRVTMSDLPLPGADLQFPGLPSPVSGPPTINNQVELRFSIRDTGLGIPPEKLGLLFNKFSQVDASTTRQFGGTGLGLAISKQLAELMGGQIGVNSEPGRGSEFWFTVRLGLQPARSRSEAPARFASLRESDNLKGVRVLVVDDNATSREMLNLRLLSWGMRPVEVSDGASALQALDAAHESGDPFQVAVLDMQMPDMDGAMLGQAIKSDERLTGIHLVLLSSLGERGDARKFAQIGFAGYLNKPLRHADLFSVLSIALAGQATPLEDPSASSLTRPIVTRHSARESRRVNVAAGSRILLVEDNITNQQVALGILKNLGLKAEAAANGLEAIKILESIPYDLVLMDVQMPEMDGLEATRHIRDLQSAVLNHNIPIIAMTAHAMQSDRERCLQAGMNDYVSKPVNPQALAEALERWLSENDRGRKGTGDGGRETEEDGRARIDDRGGSTSLTFPVPGFDLLSKSSSLPVFDKAALKQRLMDDDELVGLVIAGFLEDIPLQIQALKSYLEAGDATGAERQAHTIKGAAANIGGEALRGIAYELEKLGKSGDLLAVQERMGELEAQFARLRDVLAKEI